MTNQKNILAKIFSEGSYKIYFYGFWFVLVLFLLHAAGMLFLGYEIFYLGLVFVTITAITLLILLFRSLNKHKEDLVDSKDKMERYLDTSAAIMVDIDTDGKVWMINKGGCEILGYKKEEIIGKNWFDNFVPEHARESEKLLVLGNRQLRLMENSISPVLTKDGEERIIAWRNSPLRNKYGKIIGQFNSGVDITEAQRTLEQLKISEENLKKFQLAVENAYNVIVITNPEGYVVYANKAFERSGFKRKDAIGKKAGGREMWGGHMKKNFYENLWKTIKINKTPFVGEFVNRRKDGKKFIVQKYITPVLDDKGEVIFFVSIDRNITKEKKIDQAKTEFISIASHQLKTPLATISLAADVLLGGALGETTEEQKEYLKSIYDDVKKMSELVEMLLNISRIEMGTFTINTQPTNLTAFLNDFLKKIEPLTGEKQMEIKEVYDNSLPDDIRIDKKILTNVLENLVSNSIKYTPARGRIVLKTKRDGPKAIIEISDNGPGIPLKLQPRIFTKLFRAGDMLEKKHGKVSGSGLGLYIAKSLITAVGGKIWFKSPCENGRGTSFFVSVPLTGMKHEDFGEKDSENEEKIE